MYVALRAGADPIALVLGLSLIVPATLWVAWRMPPPVLSESELANVPPPDDESWDDWNPWLARERNPNELDDRLSRDVASDSEGSA